jgi:hypothetical protein
MSKKFKPEDYERLYNHFMDYEQSVHEKNQKRIRVGLKVNIFFPLIFLFLCFVTDASKLFFLILWILSLFGIAFYLMYVEYQDYKLQEQMKTFRGESPEDSEEEEPKILIGATVSSAGKAVTEKVDAFDDRVDEKKEELKAEFREKVQEIQEELNQKIKNATELTRESLTEMKKDSNDSDHSDKEEFPNEQTEKSRDSHTEESRAEQTENPEDSEKQ